MVYLPTRLAHRYARKWTQSSNIGYSGGGWLEFFSYLVLFLSGYLIVADQRIERAVHRHRMAALAIAICTTPLLLAPGLSLLTMNDTAYGSLGYTLAISLKSFNSWCWMLTFLGLGQKFLNFNRPALRYMSEASLPFYMLHQPIILSIGFLIAEWPVGVWPKFALLSLSAFVMISLAYELLVRRIHILRFCFGLKPI